MKKNMNLTPTEALYFDALLKNPDGISREKLHPLRPSAPPRSTNLVDVHIKDLRKKIKGSGYEIKCVRKFGYKMEKTK